MLSLNLSKPNIGNLNISISKNQYTFEYPCQTSDICTPYTIVLDRGIYKFETWGSSGSGNGIAGLGGYTSGIIHLSNVQTFYLFVGSRTNFNYKTNKGEYYSYGGASSDVRLYVNENIDWFNDLSLRSRIMVLCMKNSVTSLLTKVTLFLMVLSFICQIYKWIIML